MPAIHSLWPALAPPRWQDIRPALTVQSVFQLRLAQPELETCEAEGLPLHRPPPVPGSDVRTTNMLPARSSTVNVNQRG